MKNDNIKFVITFILAVIVSSFINAVASGNLFDSNEVTYDNTHSGMNASNVKSAVDELYAAATDYSNINSRVTNLEGYFTNSPTSVFDGHDLEIGKKETGNNNAYVDFWRNGINRGGVGVDATTGDMVLLAKNTSSQYGTGTLSLRADTIKIGNGSNTLLINGKNYFQNNPTSQFNDSGLQIGIGKTSGYGWADWYYNGTNTGNIFAGNAGLTVKTADGKNLYLKGTKVYVNNNEVTPYVDITCSSSAISWSNEQQRLTKCFQENYNSLPKYVTFTFHLNEYGQKHGIGYVYDATPHTSSSAYASFMVTNYNGITYNIRNVAGTWQYKVVNPDSGYTNVTYVI